MYLGGIDWQQQIRWIGKWDQVHFASQILVNVQDQTAT